MDKETFTRHILEMETSLFHVAKSILYQDADCEDVMQEALIKAYKKKDSLREEVYFKTWMTRILLNECYAFCRKRKQDVSYEEYMKKSECEESGMDDGLNGALYEAIQKLDRKYKLPVVLHYIDGYSVAEVSRIMRIPAGTVKSRLSKARTLLKFSLESGKIYESRLE